MNHKELAVRFLFLIHVYLGDLLILHLEFSTIKYAIPVITKQIATLVVCKAICQDFHLRVSYSMWKIKEWQIIAAVQMHATVLKKDIIFPVLQLSNYT